MQTGHYEGPHLTRLPIGLVEIILHVNAAGYLNTVEVVDFGFGLDDVYRSFIEDAAQSKLRFSYPGAS